MIVKLFQLFLANLPVLISCFAALGLFKLSGRVILSFTAEARAQAKLTKSKLDDVIVNLAAAPLEEIARLLVDGKHEEALAKVDDAKRKAEEALKFVAVKP